MPASSMPVTPPRILHVRASNFYGGPEKQILEHASRSSKYHHSVLTFADGSRDFAEHCSKAGVPVYSIELQSAFDPRVIRELRRKILIAKPSVICSHGYRSTILLSLSRINKRVPVIGFARGFTGESLKISMFEFLERRCLAGLSGVICVCDAQRRQLEDYGVRAKQWWTVHNAVSIPPEQDPAASFDLRRKLGIGMDTLLVVSAGRLSPEKGHSDLLEAISMVKADLGGTYFLICGDGPCRKSLEIKAGDLGISDRVKFLGFRRDMQDIFNAMDLLVLPSHTEGLPNVILESFSYGKPVLATEVGGVPEVVEPGRSGFLVPPKRPDLLAQALKESLIFSEKLAAMGEAGRSRVAAEFSFDEQSSKLDRIYGELLPFLLRRAVCATDISDSLECR